VRAATRLRVLLASLRIRLVLLFVLMALATTAIFVAGMQRALSAGWDALLRPIVVDYVDRLAAEIGTPPDPAHAVELVDRDGVAEALPRLAGDAVLVQEFLPEIAAGEVSLVYFDGVFSHAIRKRPPAGEFRVNSRYGATRAAETPSPSVIAQGAVALRPLPELPLYARVDGVVRDDTLIVIEIEVLEPALFLDFDPGAAERFAAATLARL